MKSITIDISDKVYKLFYNSKGHYEYRKSNR